jgi:hypothetical protein
LETAGSTHVGLEEWIPSVVDIPAVRPAWRIFCILMVQV